MKPTIYNLQFYILLSILLMTNQQTAQSFIWGRQGGSHVFFNNTSLKNQIFNLKSDSQNNYYFTATVGYINPNINGQSINYWGENNSNDFDFVLGSFNCEGNLRWSKVFGGGVVKILDILV